MSILLELFKREDFYFRIIKLIIQFFEHKDKTIDEPNKAWLYDVTTDSELMQTSCSFYRAIMIKLQKMLVPILSEIIAVLDRNDNLDLYNCEIENIPTIWTDILTNDDCTLVNYDNILITNLNIKTRIEISNDGFKNQYPFSFIIIESLDKILNKCRETYRDSLSELWNQFTQISETLWMNIVFKKRNFANTVKAFLSDYVNFNIRPKSVDETNIHMFLLIMRTLFLSNDYYSEWLVYDKNVDLGILDQEYDGPTGDISILNIYKSFSYFSNLFSILSQAFELEPALISLINDLFIKVINVNHDKKSITCFEDIADVEIAPRSIEILINVPDVFILHFLFETITPTIEIKIAKNNLLDWRARVKNISYIVASQMKQISSFHSLKEEYNILHLIWQKLLITVTFADHYVVSTSTSFSQNCVWSLWECLNSEPLEEFLLFKNTFKSIKQSPDIILKEITSKYSAYKKLAILCLKCQSAYTNPKLLSDCKHILCENCVKDAENCPLQNCKVKINKLTEANQTVKEGLKFIHQLSIIATEFLLDVTINVFGTDGFMDNMGIRQVIFALIEINEENLSSSLGMDMFNFFQNTITTSQTCIDSTILQHLVRSSLLIDDIGAITYPEKNCELLSTLPQNSFLMHVHIVEDMLHEKFQPLNDEEQIVFVNNLFDRIDKTEAPLFEGQNKESLYNLATIRFMCLVIINWIIKLYSLNPFQKLNPDFVEKYTNIIGKLNKLLRTSKDSNLKRLLLRIFQHILGYQAPRLLSEVNDLHIYLPDNLTEIVNSNSNPIFDSATIFGDNYKQTKINANLIIEGRHTEITYNQVETMENIDQDSIQQPQIELDLLFLAIYQQLLSNNITPCIEIDKQQIQHIINELIILNEKQQILFNEMIDNKLTVWENSDLTSKDFTKAANPIRALFHFYLLLTSPDLPTWLAPITNICSDPQSLMHCLLPAMEDDPHLEHKLFFEGQKGIKAEGDSNYTWYECTNGHPYVIGECGRPYSTGKCPECGVIIGGERHILHAGNIQEYLVDSTKSGYIFKRTQQQSFRNLTETTVVLIRSLIHASFYYGLTIQMSDGTLMAYADGKNLPDNPAKPAWLLPITNLLNGWNYNHPEIEFCDLRKHFFDIFLEDLAKLATIFDFDLDKACMAFHLFIERILLNKANTIESSDGQVIQKLSNRNFRGLWETAFIQNIIQPLITDIHTIVKPFAIAENALDDPIIQATMREIYEEKLGSETTASFWRYRPIMGLNHFSNAFNTLQSTEKYPLTEKFLKDKDIISITQYLPDIVKLQFQLLQRFNRKITMKNALDMTLDSISTPSFRSPEFMKE